jgi:hypothetical protein
MNDFEAIATLKTRLARAEENAEMLRRAGSQEQYLEAYFLAGALELQSDTLVNAHRDGSKA